jgi:hypothetical protein
MRLPIRHASSRRCLGVVASFVFAILSGWPADVVRAAEPIGVTPHRALYQMQLTGTRTGSSVTGVSGRMVFEWADACEGWTIEQRFQLTFQYAEGNRVEMVTNYATWETKDGLAYRFNVRRLMNGELDEEVRGDASTDALGAGRARYVRPEAREEPLPQGTLFPTAHTLALLRAARANERFLAHVVFDGSDAEGPSEISAAIGAATRPRTSLQGPGGDLLNGTMYPVRMAFFPIASGNPEPQYEMTLWLLENGVAEQILIDYGDFRVQGTLRELEALPAPRC